MKELFSCKRPLRGPSHSPEPTARASRELGRGKKRAFPRISGVMEDRGSLESGNRAPEWEGGAVHRAGQMKTPSRMGQGNGREACKRAVTLFWQSLLSGAERRKQKWICDPFGQLEILCLLWLHSHQVVGGGQKRSVIKP